MQPNITPNFAAIAAAVVASFVLGWLWYGPLFGKVWARLMGTNPGLKPDPKIMMRGMALMFAGCFLTAYVITFSGHIWRASSWGGGPDQPAHLYGFFTGFFTWLGFYVPMLLSQVAWEGRSWALFGLNAAYHFVNLQLVAMIISHWR